LQASGEAQYPTNIVMDQKSINHDHIPQDTEISSV